MRDFARVSLMFAALTMGACKDNKAPATSTDDGPDAAMVPLNADPLATADPVPATATRAPTAPAGTVAAWGTLAPSATGAPFWGDNPGDAAASSIDGALHLGAAPPMAAEPPADPAPPANAVPSGPPTARTIFPSATDPSIRNPDIPHVVLVPGGPRNGKLLVFMPGTHGKPQQIPFVTTAAAAGYLVINLSYPDSEPATVCRTDLNCFEAFRREIFDGSNVSDKVEVSPADSIRNRLVKLIAYLDSQYPSEGWRAYLAGNDLAYSSIVFAGHSQGGGFAAYIAKYHEVQRVIMFSSVVDAAEGNPPIPALWVSTGHVTPTDRYYGFGHVSDRFAPKIAVDWYALGMEALGPRHSVDGDRAPFGHSHQLITSIPMPDAQHAHSSVLAATNDDNTPAFVEVWQYMLR